MPGLQEEKMRSAKETGCFPYRSKLVCYMELSNEGDIKQLSTRDAKFQAYLNAKAGVSKILAVWPGQWRSDLFIVDELDSFLDVHPWYHPWYGNDVDLA